MDTDNTRMGNLLPMLFFKIITTKHAKSTEYADDRRQKMDDESLPQKSTKGTGTAGTTEL